MGDERDWRDPGVVEDYPGVTAKDPEPLTLWKVVVIVLCLGTLPGIGSAVAFAVSGKERDAKTCDILLRARIETNVGRREARVNYGVDELFAATAGQARHREESAGGTVGAASTTAAHIYRGVVVPAKRTISRNTVTLDYPSCAPRVDRLTALGEENRRVAKFTARVNHFRARAGLPPAPVPPH